MVHLEYEIKFQLKWDIYFEWILQKGNDFQPRETFGVFILKVNSLNDLSIQINKIKVSVI